MADQKTEKKDVEAFQIPDEIITGVNEFLSRPKSDNSEEIIGGKPDAVNTDLIEKFMESGFGMADRMFKSQGLPGLSGVKPSEMAEITSKFLEHEGLTDVLKDSPRYMFGSMCAMIVANNAIALQKLKKGQPENE